MSFGPPPESNELSYPGISGKRFNPVEAQRCYAESVRKEKEGRYVHMYLDMHGKLGLDEAWANDVGRGSGIMPDYESLSGVYGQLGWKVLASGRVVPPDPKKMVKRRKKSRQKKGTYPCTCNKKETSVSGLNDSSSEPILRGTSSGKLDALQVANKARSKASMSASGKSVCSHTSAAARKSNAAPVAPAPIGAAGVSQTLLRSTQSSVAKQKSALPGAVPSATYIPRAGTLLVQAVLRKNMSAPSLSTAKRPADRRFSG